MTVNPRDAEQPLARGRVKSNAPVKWNVTNLSCSMMIIPNKNIHGPEKQWIPSQYLISEYAL
jgi:hypothetical protein